MGALIINWISYVLLGQRSFRFYHQPDAEPEAEGERLDLRDGVHFIDGVVILHKLFLKKIKVCIDKTGKTDILYVKVFQMIHFEERL